jgi:hypothetical protein
MVTSAPGTLVLSRTLAGRTTMFYEPLDTNGDGVAETWGTDYNGDGLYEAQATDGNGNGIIDTYGTDANQNGYFETISVDANEDGTIDYVLLDTNENGVEDRLEYSPTHTAPGSAGPTTSPVVWASGNDGMAFGPGAEVVMDGNSHAINTTLTPDGYEYVPKDY